MSKTILARELNSNPDFFREWKENLSTVSEADQQQINRIKSNYFYLSHDRPLPEQTVKMVVLSPFLDLAGFYQPPLKM